MTIEKKQDFGWNRKEMAKRTALDIPNGSYVNLGIGIPEMVAQYVPEGREVIYHTENGLLGMGPAPEAGQEDPAEHDQEPGLCLVPVFDQEDDEWDHQPGQEEQNQSPADALFESEDQEHDPSAEIEDGSRHEEEVCAGDHVAPFSFHSTARGLRMTQVYTSP